MKTVFSSSLVLAVLLFLVAGVRAGDKKEVTLKGELMCAKCELKEEGVKKCQTVIQVKEDDGKVVTYYFKDKGSKEEYHESVCGGGRKQATVTGVVTEKNGKKWITPSKVQVS